MNMELWPEYSFGDREHLTATKFNSILRVLEIGRRATGPFSISQLGVTGSNYTPTITSMWVQLDDDPWVIGGVNTATSPPQTYRRFTFDLYNGNESLTSGFCRWDNMYFASGTIEGSTYWSVQLTSGNKTYGMVGANSLNMSSFIISSFTCYTFS